MADLTKSKNKNGGNQYPVDVIDSTNLVKRVEPIINADLLVSRYLHDVDISSYSKEDLEDMIVLAINEVELMLRVTINRTQFEERMPFDRSLYHSFIHLVTKHKPIISVEELAVKSSNGEIIFQMPLEWIDLGQANLGQINVIPLLTNYASSGIVNGSPNGTLVFLQSISAYNWVPSFWSLKYTHGLSTKEGQVPVLVNMVIGMTATMEVLANLQAGITAGSQSLSQDGIAQSASSKNNGDIYASRIEMLGQKRDRIIDMLRARITQKYYVSNI